jgi:hypothetical protein
MRATFVLAHPTARRLALEYIKNAADGSVVQVKPKTRSLQQNARLWPLLREVSEQVDWHGRKLDPESWKDVFSAALKKQDVVPNLDGTGFVVLGQHTSVMSIKEMSDMIELITAFGVERGVQFRDDVEVLNPSN